MAEYQSKKTNRQITIQITQHRKPTLNDMNPGLTPGALKE